MPEYSKGDKFTEKLTKSGGSHYLLVGESLKKYLGLEDADNDELVLLIEESKKGKYLAIYKKNGV